MFYQTINGYVLLMLQYCNLHCMEGVPIFIRGSPIPWGRLGIWVPIIRMWTQSPQLFLGVLNLMITRQQIRQSGSLQVDTNYIYLFLWNHNAWSGLLPLPGSLQVIICEHERGNYVYKEVNRASIKALIYNINCLLPFWNCVLGYICLTDNYCMSCMHSIAYYII